MKPGRFALSRVVSAMLVGLTAAVLVTPSTPAAGQTTSSVAPSDGETTTAPPSPTPSPTSSPTSTPDPTLATGAESPAPTSPEPALPESTTTTDVLVDEAPAESVPETDETVPPSGSYSGQAEFKPQEVLWSSVRTAEAKVATATANHEAAVESARSARLEHKESRSRRAALSGERREAVLELAQAETDLQERAIAAFVANDAAAAATIASLQAADHDGILDIQARRVLLDVALGQDELAIKNYTRLRGQLDQSVLKALDETRQAARRIRGAVTVAEGTAADVVQAENELESFRAGSAIYISGVVYPLAWPYDVPLIDSYGFPRMPGTPDEHWHEGIDLFAPAGTPLLAAERGVITRVKSGRLGGLTFWMRGESGADWYYAHLQSYVPEMAVGLVVEAGDVLGFVGTTGNAVGTPPHVHLQIHPNGGDPVNPYPLLWVASERERAAAGHDAGSD